MWPHAPSFLICKFSPCYPQSVRKQMDLHTIGVFHHCSVLAQRALHTLAKQHLVFVQPSPMPLVSKSWCDDNAVLSWSPVSMVNSCWHSSASWGLRICTDPCYHGHAIFRGREQVPGTSLNSLMQQGFIKCTFKRRGTVSIQMASVPFSLNTHDSFYARNSTQY